MDHFTFKGGGGVVGQLPKRNPVQQKKREKHLCTVDQEKKNRASFSTRRILSVQKIHHFHLSLALKHKFKLFTESGII